MPKVIKITFITTLNRNAHLELVEHDATDSDSLQI